MRNYRRYKLTIFIALIVTLLIMALFFINFSVLFASTKVTSENFFGYLDTGEGTYYIFKLEITNKKVIKNFLCIGDGDLVTYNSNLASKIRSRKPGQNLVINDASLIKEAFKDEKGIKMKFIKTFIKNKNLSFTTEEKVVETETTPVKFRFVGSIKDAKIIGEIFYEYQGDGFEQSDKIEFRRDN